MTPEYIIEICVYIDVAIIGIAYPIIVDKISNIGEKYSSEYIPVIFNTEFPQKQWNFTINKNTYPISIFKLTLYFTLFSLLFLIFQSPPLFGWDNWIINNSAKLLTFLLSSTLTIFFFRWLDKVALYNGKSTSLLKHLIGKYDAFKDDTDMRQYCLKAINELTFYAIEKQDEHLQATLLQFYSQVFVTIREKHNKNKPLIYPIDLYFLVRRLTEESISIDNKKLRGIESRAVSGTWLLGQGSGYIPISRETYGWLWGNVYTICDNARLIKLFWAHSSQYYDFQLQAIYPLYNSAQRQNINQQEINNRKTERELFLEFHYALGGLLLYRNQYKSLKYIFEYSQSQPPKYPLLPQSMSEIFYWFENFRNEFRNTGTPIDLIYYFPELDNLGNRRQVKYWICSYITVLFLRQYSLHQYYTFQNFTALPNLPDDLMELNSWFDGISFFEKCLNDILSNQALIAELEYKELVILKNQEFTQFIKYLKLAIKGKINQQKLSANLAQDKINNFLTHSNKIITEGFNSYNTIFVAMNKELLKSELKLSVTGATTLMSKAAFTDNDVPHMNYDTVFAGSIVAEIKRLIPNSFFIAKTRRYLLNRGNILLALSKIIGHTSDVVIIAISLSYEIKEVKEVLDKSIFKERVRYIESSEYHFQDVIFVLRTKNLPAIEHRNIKEEEQRELQLVEINKDLKIYASVIDINKPENKVIKDKWNLDNEPDNLDLKVQLAISFISVIYWRNDREIIQINLESEFREQGIQSDINEIDPLSN
jgi:hypothetical protein